MTAVPTEAWPTAALDPVSRLRVLAGALPHVALVERELPVPYERVWAFVSDPRSVPRFDRAVPWVKVLRRRGDELLLLAGPVYFRARVADGFVWMQAPRHLYVVGQAVRRLDGGRTLLAHLEGIPTRLGRPFARRLARHVRHDVEGIARLLGAPAP